MAQTVSVVTVGCGRNVVDSDELAARLAEAGWQLSPDGAVVVVNMCGFIESARTQSLDVLLDAAATGATVVAVGCMAERYGKDLAAALPEAAAVLSFDDYALTPRRHRTASRMACRARGSRGVAGQREHHVLRQEPR